MWKNKIVCIINVQYIDVCWQKRKKEEKKLHLKAKRKSTLRQQNESENLGQFACFAVYLFYILSIGKRMQISIIV